MAQLQDQYSGTAAELNLKQFNKHSLLIVFFSLNMCNMHVACSATVPSRPLHLFSRSHTQGIPFPEEKWLCKESYRNIISSMLWLVLWV